MLQLLLMILIKDMPFFPLSQTSVLGLVRDDYIILLFSLHQWFSCLCKHIKELLILKLKRDAQINQLGMSKTAGMEKILV
nr:hypothetical protein [Tanacetum cinerariifolium]